MLVMAMAWPGAAQTSAGQRLVAGQRAVAARKAAAKKKAAAGPVMTRARIELSQKMVRNAYELGRTLEAKRRVALMTRLLYTMRPEVMAAEKKEWAEELFGLAQELPRNEVVEVDSQRNAAIATAAARLAVYDPERALELLDTLAPQRGSHEDARTMAARLVFAAYMRRHPSEGAATVLAHAKKWGEKGEFPYSASATALAKLRTNEDAAEDFFRQALGMFKRGREGLYGVRDFAGLLEQAAVLEAITEDSAEEAGQAIVNQLRKWVVDPDIALTAEQKGMVVTALADVRAAAPKAYEEARKTAPELFTVRVETVRVKVEVPKVDAGLQTAFREVAEAMREKRSVDAVHEVIARGLQVVNAKYKAGACGDCASPDAQSWALISLSALAAPMTIATQLNGIEDPFWHAYFLAIAAQQVGEPTRVADPTARKIPGKEEAEEE